eukprot:2514794-Rhodomonas_salina.1
MAAAEPCGFLSLAFALGMRSPVFKSDSRAAHSDHSGSSSVSLAGPGVQAAARLFQVVEDTHWQAPSLSQAASGLTERWHSESLAHSVHNLLQKFCCPSQPGFRRRVWHSFENKFRTQCQCARAKVQWRGVPSAKLDP